ncbi:MAG: hypothetical protein UY05_C0006G0009 [Candidatus Peregrinibacteria bacterium GW2011_GWA2_47_7]|nr:MAG: hypothetical protein UY05_C0006G0009 [Candidatus Peregrinibacteria bacterium GW2011_GWA2_47_7]
MSDHNNKAEFFFAKILFFLLPLHALLVTVLNFKLEVTEVPLLITAWKEIVIALLTVFAIVNIVRKKTTLRIDTVSVLILLYLGLGILSYFVHEYEFGLKQWIFGMRFDFSFLIAFLIFRHLGFSENQRAQLIKLLLLSSAIAVGYGLLTFVVFLFVDPAMLTYLGFRNDWSTFIPGEALAFCQRLENTGFCRLQSTFAGPNQYGIFLVFLAGAVWFSSFKEISILRYKNNLLATIAISLLLTLSRSAWIGFMAAVGMAVVVFYGDEIKNSIKKRRAMLMVVMVSMVIMAVAALTIPSVRHAIIRPGSTSGHFQNAYIATERMWKHPFGEGLATVGPASSYFHKPGEAFHPENWYLQVGIEMGWIGMALFLAIIVLMAQRLFKERLKMSAGVPLGKIALFGLCGIAIAGLFLHSFEDAPTTLLIFSVIGMALL